MPTKTVKLPTEGFYDYSEEGGVYPGAAPGAAEELTSGLELKFIFSLNSAIVSKSVYFCLNI